ncbi:uncharacterized protein LOC141907307 [Tubulanus polymorphus]|uniref:uncharacterized protein LOC141907307 n=1 Tax=Tubulanus polymorphus TaxID=672921 RepID=UPI003DA5D5AF
MFVFIASSNDRCPGNDEVEFADSCYYFNEKELTQLQVQTSCQNRGMSQLDVESQEERDFIVGQMGKRKWNSAWTGGTLTQTDWHWEHNMTSLDIGAQGCFVDKKDGIFNSKNRDLQVRIRRSNSMTIDICMKLCKHEKWKYAGLQYAKECWCGNKYGRYGYGISCGLQCSGDRTKNCGGPLHNYIYNVNGGFDFWKKNRPNSGRETKSCAVISAFDYRWSEQTCSALLKFICEIKGTETCDNVKKGGRCLYASSVKLSWFKAREFCAKRGGGLLTITTTMQQVEVRSFISHLKGSDNLIDKFWIGATNVKWMLHTGQPMVYTDWFKTYPKKVKASVEQCVAMFTLTVGLEGPKVHWSEAPCSSPLPNVCEKKLPPRTTTTTHEPSTSATTTRTITMSTASSSTYEIPKTTVTKTTTKSTTTLPRSTITSSTPKQSTMTTSTSTTHPPTTITDSPSTSKPMTSPLISTMTPSTTKSATTRPTTTLTTSTPTNKPISSPLTSKTTTSTHATKPITTSQKSTKTSSSPTTQPMSSPSTITTTSATTTGPITTSPKFTMTSRTQTTKPIATSPTSTMTPSTQTTRLMTTSSKSTMTSSTQTTEPITTSLKSTMTSSPQTTKPITTSLKSTMTTYTLTTQRITSTSITKTTTSLITKPKSSPPTTSTTDSSLTTRRMTTRPSSAKPLPTVEHTSSQANTRPTTPTIKPETTEPATSRTTNNSLITARPTSTEPTVTSPTTIEITTTQSASTKSVITTPKQTMFPSTSRRPMMSSSPSIHRTSTMVGELSTGTTTSQSSKLPSFFTSTMSLSSPSEMISSTTIPLTTRRKTTISPPKISTTNDPSTTDKSISTLIGESTSYPKLSTHYLFSTSVQTTAVAGQLSNSANGMNIYTVLGIGVGIGVVIVLFVLLIFIINSKRNRSQYKAKRLREFDQHSIRRQPNYERSDSLNYANPLFSSDDPTYAVVDQDLINGPRKIPNSLTLGHQQGDEELLYCDNPIYDGISSRLRDDSSLKWNMIVTEEGGSINNDQSEA